MVGGPKVKRTREKAESRKREGVWSVLRKRLKMTCGHCGAPGHNQRKCPLTKSVGPELHVVPLSAAVVDTNGDESEEDEQPTMQPKRISEAKTRLEAKKVPHRPTGTRKIGFKRDENGASIPKNLPYSPKKLSYKGNAAMTSNQLNVEKKKRIGKLKTMRGEVILSSRKKK
ncbi:putative DNA damage-binding protein 1-like isoform X1 [Capsicum annuum]|nr:putative DNA damage-binding protein 1-like isoform X1 [Capsicum annuum]